MDLDDTIVAVSSPPGAAERGIVRLCGPGSLEIARRLFVADAPRAFSELSASTCLAGRVKAGQARLPARLYSFPAAASYARQDMLEIHLLGAPIVLAMVLEACLAAGARRAGPGEFTARAFVAGVLDLSQVHAVAGIVAAQSDTQLEAAGRLLHGALHRTALAAREELSDLLSLVEGALDFADEPIEFIAPAELCRRLQAVHASLRRTLEAGVRAERWGEPARVVLVGRSNVGKSSLFNRLTGMQRALCAPIMGTTRDTLSAPLTVGDFECLLLDVPGLETLARQAEGLPASVQAAARHTVASADLLLEVREATSENPTDAGSTGAAERKTPRILVINKIDQLRPAMADARVVLTSARTGEGCDELKAAIADALRDKPPDARESAVALVSEHHRALEQGVAALDRAIQIAHHAKASLIESELVAAELRSAAGSLGVLVGQDDSEDLLGRIFSRFCVGK